MDQQTFNLFVLGAEISFRPGADMERARHAAQLVEERFAEQKLRTKGTQTKDRLLIYLVLGMADNLLQMKKAQDDTQKRLDSLLAKIEKYL